MSKSDLAEKHFTDILLIFFFSAKETYDLSDFDSVDGLKFDLFFPSESCETGFFWSTQQETQKFFL